LANQTGKRYVCSKCNSEFIVTKGGDGAIYTDWKYSSPYLPRGLN
jgi:transposase-like protein